jgi:hypothetical protein
MINERTILWAAGHKIVSRFKCKKPASRFLYSNAEKTSAQQACQSSSNGQDGRILIGFMSESIRKMERSEKSGGANT